MAKASSIHFIAAKNSADKHNKREKDLDYVRKELEENIPLEKWRWERDGYTSVAKMRKQAEKEYKSKEVTVTGNHGTYVTHRSMPKNAEPVKEGVVAINQNVTMEQLRAFGEWTRQEYGITPMAIYIHLGEGHWAPLDEEKGQTEDMYRRDDHEWKRINELGETEYWKPNFHAHMVYDWFDHDSKRCFNLGPSVMRRLEDELPKFLNMERGVSSNKKWIEATAFKAKAEVERINKGVEKAESELQTVESEKKKAEKTVKSLSTMIANLNTQISDLEQRKTQGEGDIEELNRKIEDLQVKVTDKEKKLEDANNKYDNLVNQIAEMKKKTGIGAMVAGFFKVGEEAEIRQEIENVKAERDDANAKIDLAKKYALQKIENAEKKKNAEIKDLQGKFDKQLQEERNNAIAKGKENFINDYMDGYQSERKGKTLSSKEARKLGEYAGRLMNEKERLASENESMRDAVEENKQLKKSIAGLQEKANQYDKVKQQIESAEQRAAEAEHKLNYLMSFDDMRQKWQEIQDKIEGNVSSFWRAIDENIINAQKQIRKISLTTHDHDFDDDESGLFIRGVVAQIFKSYKSSFSRNYRFDTSENDVKNAVSELIDNTDFSRKEDGFTTNFRCDLAQNRSYQLSETIDLNKLDVTLNSIFVELLVLENGGLSVDGGGGGNSQLRWDGLTDDDICRILEGKGRRIH